MDAAHQRGLALRDLVGRSDGLDLLIGGELLCNHGSLEGAQCRVNLSGETGRDFCGFLCIIAGDRQQDRVGELTEVAVFHHGTDDGVGGHINVHAGQRHIIEDQGSVLVEGLGGNDPFGVVDPQLNAGVHIHFNNIVQCPEAVPPEHAADHDAGRRSKA